MSLWFLNLLWLYVLYDSVRPLRAVFRAGIVMHLYVAQNDIKALHIWKSSCVVGYCHFALFGEIACLL